MLYIHHLFKDYDGDLIDADRLFNIIMPQQHVKSVVYGHTHSYNYTKRGNIHLINLFATGYNFSPSEPIDWVEASFTKKADRLNYMPLKAIRRKTAALQS